MALKQYPIDYMYDTSTFLGRGGVSGRYVDKSTSASSGGGSSGTTKPPPIVFPRLPAIDRRDIKIPSSTGVFDLGLGSIDFRKIGSVSEISRIVNLQIQATLQGRTQAAVIRPPSPPARISPSPTGGGLISQTISTKGANNMALDLGSLLGNLGGAYIDARFNAQPSYNYGPSVAPPMTMPALGVPFVDVIPETSARNQVWDPRANCGQGKWIRRNKRRRRRLATASDIKDLAALKNVTSGPQMNTWIATHPT